MYGVQVTSLQIFNKFGEYARVVFRFTPRTPYRWTNLTPQTLFRKYVRPFLPRIQHDRLQVITLVAHDKNVKQSTKARGPLGP